MGTNADFKMDWDNVRIFLSVARAGQFSAAASQLRIDNGTVGRRINALEKPPSFACFGKRLEAC
jgi:regulatory helix-turn-helix LysR family protein